MGRRGEWPVEESRDALPLPNQCESDVRLAIYPPHAYTPRSGFDLQPPELPAKRHVAIARVRCPTAQKRTF
ncbi:hypothetical protein MPLDJ20_150068 [Mesorhizobium plurifarium]|uniref:Uncharacterized protein n=1 Tax=Mesorhizobium plurifarium TaxID=69974 RepID=A0A090EME4_MESPL|nr:hypothetical protein MPLDJ20_150068 [Mesorhizobium plurifarium]